MKNLAIIPARSGSKGLKNKNIKPLNGKPLMAYSIEAAIESKLFDEVVLSTDSEEYALIGRNVGAKVPYLRSESLSNDSASSWDVVRDIVEWFAKQGEKFDTVTLLQPTSPLRTATDIVEGFELYIKKEAELVIGVTEADHSPIWMNTLPDDLSMNSFLDNSYSQMPRQQLPSYYRINGSLYIISVEHLFDQNNFYSDKSYGFVMSEKNSVDIDTEIDFIFAEAILKKLDYNLTEENKINSREIERVVLNYEEKKFIDYIKSNFIDINNKSTLIENQNVLKSIDEKIKNHAIAKLDQIIISQEDDPQILSIFTLSFTVLFFMVENLFDLEKIKGIMEIMVFIILLALVYQAYLFILKRKRKNVAIYFRTLLKEVTKE